MKFTDGYWVMRDGVKPAYAQTIMDTKVEKEKISLQVATKIIRHRGDTLGGEALKPMRYHSELTLDL